MQPSSNPPFERSGPSSSPSRKANPKAPSQKLAPIENANWPDDYEPAEEGSAEKLRQRQVRVQDQLPRENAELGGSVPFAPQPPARLGTFGKTEILYTTQTTLESSDDTLWVIPADRNGVPGHFGEALIAALPRLDRATLQNAISQGDAPLTPDHPLQIPMAEEESSGHLVRYSRFLIATANGTDGTPTVVNAVVAMLASVRLAENEQNLRSLMGGFQLVKRLVLPLIGCGWNKLDPVEVSTRFIRDLANHPPDDSLPEILLPGLPDHVVVALRKVFLRLEKGDDPNVALVQPLSNDASFGPDRLGIEPEAFAIAEAIASKDMEPPLVVGILGGWGAGKSFVLHLIEQRLRQIRGHSLLRNEDEEGPPFAFIGHPYVIRFDAWTYAKSNLWASLMQTVFFELNRQLSLEKAVRDRVAQMKKDAEGDVAEGKPARPALDEATLWRTLADMSDRQRSELLETPAGREALAILAEIDSGEADASMLWKRLEQIKAEDVKSLRESEEKLAAKKAEFEAARRELEAEVDAELEIEARRDAWWPLADRLKKFVGGAFVDQLAKKGVKPEELPELRTLFERKSWTEKLGLGFNVQTAALLAFAALGALLPQLLSTRWVANTMSLLATAAGALATVGRAIQNARTAFEKQRADYEASLAATREKRTKEREKRIEERLHKDEERHANTQKKRAEQGAPSQQPGQEGASEKRATGKASLTALAADVRQLEADVEMHRQRVGMTARYPSLVDFVRGRAASDEYAGQLGLLHRVQSDISELTEGLMPGPQDSEVQKKLKSELFPRGKPRIVLIVDDLDRCPPDRVVEVLEAAQLLVKTRLFVVVLAMDVRYVTRALEKVYRGVLRRHGDPSGLDYLEKIVQVPYRVRPVDSKQLRDFLAANVKLRAAKEVKLDPKSMVATGGLMSVEEVRNVIGVPGPEVLPAIGKATAGAGANPEHRASGLEPALDAVKQRRVELPSEILEFSEDDLDVLDAACKSSDLTPRSIKRLSNVFKLMKIVWYRRGQGEGPDKKVKQALVSLLAVSARYPEVMRPFLRQHEHCLAKLAKDALPSTTTELWSAAYTSILAQQHLVSVVANEIRRVGELLADAGLFPEDGWRTLRACEDARLVSTFSFLGEDTSGIDGSLPARP